MVGFPSSPAGKKMPWFGIVPVLAKFIWTSPLATRSSPLLTFGASWPVEREGPALFFWSSLR